MFNVSDGLEPWVNDCLNRKSDAENIQQYLDVKYGSCTDDQGFVLALNGEWGSGKTFLLTNWYEQAKIDDRAVIFFDAWKNDFSKDPFLAFVAEINVAVDRFFAVLGVNSAATRSLKERLGDLMVPTAKLFGSAMLKHGAGLTLEAAQAYFENEEFDFEDASQTHGKEVIKDVSSGLKKLFDDSLKAQKTHKQAMEAFKIKLRELVRALSDVGQIKLPLIIYIDELDRCRPTYAIELLEVIKHLFGVSGVYFVIGTNIKQLSHSVKAVYGENFDGVAYLRRFFDMQYALKEPSNDQFALELMSKINLPDERRVRINGGLFAVPNRFEIANVQNVIAFIFSEFATAFELTLRDMQQIQVNISAAFSGLYSGGNNLNQNVHPILLIFLAVLYHKCPNAFRLVKIHHCLSLSKDHPLLEEFNPEVQFDQQHLGRKSRKIDVGTGGERIARQINVFSDVCEYFGVSGNQRPPDNVAGEFFSYRADPVIVAAALNEYINLIERSASFRSLVN